MIRDCSRPGGLKKSGYFLQDLNWKLLKATARPEKPSGNGSGVLISSLGREAVGKPWETKRKVAGPKK